MNQKACRYTYWLLLMVIFGKNNFITNRTTGHLFTACAHKYSIYKQYNVVFKCLMKYLVHQFYSLVLFIPLLGLFSTFVLFLMVLFHLCYKQMRLKRGQRSRVTFSLWEKHQYFLLHRQETFLLMSSESLQKQTVKEWILSVVANDAASDWIQPGV